MIYEVAWFPQEPFSLTVEHYMLEKMVFNHIDGCPKSYAVFRRRYEQKAFILVTARNERELCGFKLSEKVSDTHYHHHIIAVHPVYRNAGIGQRMSDIIGQALLANKVRYITLFAIPMSTELELEPSFIQPLAGTWGQPLGEEESALLARLKSHKGSDRIDSVRRVQSKYYTLTDGSAADALYKAYRIEG